MKSLFVKHLLSFIIFSPFLIILLASDNSRINMMLSNHDSSYCSSIKRTFLKNKCYELFINIEKNKCLKISHARLQRKCIDNVIRSKKVSSQWGLNSLIVLFEIIFLWIVSNAMLGNFYHHRLDTLAQIQYLSKAILYYRHIQMNHVNSFFRFLTGISMILTFLFLDSYLW